MRAVALALALVGCGAETASGDEGPPVDSTLVALLADLHLADARASLSADSTGETARDSLRAVAFAAHGTEADRVEDRLDALGRDPELARATYGAVQDRLESEGQGFIIP